MIHNKTIFVANKWSDTSVNQQSKALALDLSKNNKVIFLDAGKNGNYPKNINQNLIVLEWPGKRPTGWKDLLFATRLMRINKPDIIITNFAANDIMLFVSWLFHIKTRVCYFHTMVEQYIADHRRLPLNQRINIFRKGFVFRMATHMLCPSEAAKRDLVKFYKVNPCKAFVFSNALPDRPCRNKSNNNRIGYLGRLDRSKGVDILIRAFALLVREVEAQLEIAGSGKRETELKELVSMLGLTEKVIFRGTIPYSEVLNFLSSVNFIVVPSRMDNLPTVILEAFSVATPVIGSNSGGIADIITPGYNGLLFENENEKDLTDKMFALITNKQQRSVISKNVRKTFEEKYCMNTLLQRFAHLLQQ
jgi:glycosyltransferase involved in cell wall biosynthesis